MFYESKSCRVIQNYLLQEKKLIKNSNFFQRLKILVDFPTWSDDEAKEEKEEEQEQEQEEEEEEEEEEEKEEKSISHRRRRQRSNPMVILGAGSYSTAFL